MSEWGGSSSSPHKIVRHEETGQGWRMPSVFSRASMRMLRFADAAHKWHHHSVANPMINAHVKRRMDPYIAVPGNTSCRKMLILQGHDMITDHQEMAQASGNDEQMPESVKVPNPCIIHEKHCADGVTQPSSNDQCDAGRRK